MIPAMTRRWLGVELIEVSAVEKLAAACGGGLAILLLAMLTRSAVADAGSAAVIASMGATAVLLFAVPHGPLSQPWPVFAGHGISALVGVLCARFLHHPWIAAACAVGLSIGLMHQFKCIHPPGGATAFTAVMGGEAIHRLGFGFILFPVLLNAVVMIVLAVLINGFFRWRRYPSVLNQPAVIPGDAGQNPPPSHEEVLAALKSLDSFVDISEEDLTHLAVLLSRSQTRPRGDQGKGA